MFTDSYGNYIQINPAGSRLEKEILTKTVDQGKLLQQIKELEGMTACAGIRNNEGAAYKARVNHYGGVSSWGMPLPVRRWVDSAYSDTKRSIGFGPNGWNDKITISYKGRNSKAIADYIAKKLVPNPKSIPEVYKKVTYDELVENYPGEFKRISQQIKSEIGEMEQIYSYADTYQEQIDKVKRNRIRSRGWEEGWHKRAVGSTVGPGGIEDLYNIEAHKEQTAGLFGVVGKGKPYMMTPNSFMKGLASKMAANQRRAIRNMTPPNSPVTEAIKGQNSPLIWTGEMLAAVESWVDK